MITKDSQGQKSKQVQENDDADKKKSHGKQLSGGEPSKHALALHADEAAERQSDINLAEGKDNKKGNVGPSGQGTHRGRERRNKQTKASGRPDVSSIGHASSER